MAVNYNQPATIANLQQVVNNMKTYVDSDKTVSIKGYLKENNTHNFYNTSTPTENTTPIFSFDIPTEYFLDQTKTTFVQEFAWSDITYVGSTNPNLDGKPVFVLAVKGEDSVSYSFVNLETLIDTYKTKDTATLSLDITDNEISGEVNISEAEGNAVILKNDGLYVPTTAETKISEADGNQIISNDDGIYVGLNEKVLTMAEYEALSDDEKASDTTYYISDYTSDEESGSSTDMSDYIKKTSIITTIDENSTDEQIPSAKVVNDTFIKTTDLVMGYMDRVIIEVETAVIAGSEDAATLNIDKTFVYRLGDRVDIRIVIDAPDGFNNVGVDSIIASIDFDETDMPLMKKGIYNFSFTGRDGAYGFLQGVVDDNNNIVRLRTILGDNFVNIAGAEPMIIQGTVFLEN